MSDVAVSDNVRVNIHAKSRVSSLPIRQQDFGLPENRDRLEAFGFKLTKGGAHISRTIMLTEINRLLASSAPGASAEDYQRAVISENLLGKATETTRQKTFRHLRELYALSPKVPIFSIYRELVQFDPQPGPLLSLLIAWARDPLLRATTPAILGATFGDQVRGDDLQQALTEAYPHQYSANNIGKIARNAASSWTQSGHLTGRAKKVRSRVQPRPSALTFALILGQVAGAAGAQLFSSISCRLLDLNPSEARSLAEQAHRQELITLKAVGSVVEISFPRFRHFLKGYQ
jgi:hypothetical protein